MLTYDRLVLVQLYLPSPTPPITRGVGEPLAYVAMHLPAAGLLYHKKIVEEEEDDLHMALLTCI